MIDYQDNNTESFYRDFEEINTNLKNTPSISHAWQEFTEHITFDKNITGGHVVKNSIQPSSYFSVGNILAKNIIIKRSHYVPRNLLGLGTVGSFFVFLAMESMGATSDHVLNVSVSFTMGLVFAFFLYMLKTREIIHIEDKLREFNTNLENALVFSTADQVLYELLNALVEQNKKLDGISNNIALSKSNFSDLDLTREKQNNELLHTLVYSFYDKLQQLFTEQGQHRDETLAELKQHNSTTADEFYHKLQQLFTEQGQHRDETLAELKQHNSTTADEFYHKLQQLFTEQGQHRDENTCRT